MKRSKFSLSHYKLLTCQMGGLIPIAWYEALPGDTIQMSTSCLVRAAPLNAPIMHPVQVRIHHFFVPNRLIWTDTAGSPSDPAPGWESFITGGASGTDTTNHPYMIFGGNVAQSSLADYLGLPTANMPSGFTVSALPFRAYAMIWNYYYRDEDLQSNLALSIASGNDTTTSQVLQNCDWEKDYLTSCRPWESKGPAVSIFGAASQAPVSGIGVNSADGAATAGVTYWDATKTTVQSAPAWSTGTQALVAVAQSAAVPGAANVPQIFAQLGSATGVGVDINTLRHQFGIARFQEARARYGSRYVEYLRYLGIRSSDARLQRPEYLGGGRQTISFSEVLQTAVTTSGTGQLGVGAFGGHGIAAMRSNRFRRFFEEHGIIMSLMSIRPRTMYSNPVRRAWLRGMPSGNGVPGQYLGIQGTKEDYFMPELQSIGQQAVNGSEADASAGNVILGYQDRYDEYRRLESSVHGAFRASPLDVWHLSREFGSAPSLNATFVSCVPSTRIFQVTSGDNCYVMCNHSIQARRMMKKVGSSRVL
jgi:hypothetical protein